MTPEFSIIVGLLISIVSFFLIKTMTKLDTTHELSVKNETKILLLQQREEITTKHLDEKFNTLHVSITEIKTMIKKNSTEKKLIKNKMKPHVLIDAGHGGLINGKYVTAGKRSPIWNDLPQLFEGVQNREIASLVKEKLRALNIGFTDIVNSNEDISRSARIVRVNNIYASNKDAILISIHADAAGTGSSNHPASGMSVYTSIGETKSDLLATDIIVELQSAFGDSIKWRTDMTDKDKDKEENFDMVKLTACPAVLCELGFMTNRIECERMQTLDFKNKCADAIVSGIKKYYELD